MQKRGMARLVELRKILFWRSSAYRLASPDSGRLGVIAGSKGGKKRVQEDKFPVIEVIDS
jgi:hypothetical protein